MAAGIQVFNDSNFIQIDGDYRNLEFKQKGSVNIPGSNAAGGGGVVSYVTVSYSGVDPVIAINSSGFSYASISSISGNTYTWMIYNGETSAQTVEYFIFAQPSSSSAGNSGIEIRDAAGSLVFDSNKRYLRVMDYLESSKVSEDQTRSYDAKPAFLMCDFGYRYVVTASPTDPSNSSVKFVQSWLHLGKVSGNQFQLKDTATYTNARVDSANQVGSSEYPSRWLIVNVAGY